MTNSENYRALLPAWAIFIIIFTLVLAALSLVPWECVLFVSLTGLILSWVWLKECQETIRFLKPEASTPLMVIPAALRSTLSEFKDALERYATVTQNLSGAVLVRDRDGKITYCNPYTERLFGVSRDEILESEQDFIASITSETDIETYRKAHMLSLIGEPFRYRHRFRHASGPEMWAETRVVPLLNTQGDVDATLSIMIDVTKSVRVEEETERLNADLKDFYYMISHDLRTPLVTLKGGLGMLRPLVEKEDCKEMTEMYDHLMHARNRLDTLVNAVVDYGKISSQGFELFAVDPLPILLDVVRMYEPQVKEAGGWIKIPEGIPAIQASPVPLSQIFSNLIENAIKYSHPERPPQVEVSYETVPGLIPEVQIKISDNGLGIPADKIENIFRPFQRGHPTVKRGSGVGLASVKKLVEKLGGTIEVESFEGEGTVFLVILESRN